MWFFFFFFYLLFFFFFQAEDGIRVLVRSRGLGDVYKRQSLASAVSGESRCFPRAANRERIVLEVKAQRISVPLYFSRTTASISSSAFEASGTLVPKATTRIAFFGESLPFFIIDASVAVAKKRSTPASNEAQRRVHPRL